MEVEEASVGCSVRVTGARAPDAFLPRTGVRVPDAFLPRTGVHTGSSVLLGAAGTEAATGQTFDVHDGADTTAAEEAVTTPPSPPREGMEQEEEG